MQDYFSSTLTALAKTSNNSLYINLPFVHKNNDYNSQHEVTWQKVECHNIVLVCVRN